MRAAKGELSRLSCGCDCTVKAVAKVKATRCVKIARCDTLSLTHTAPRHGGLDIALITVRFVFHREKEEDLERRFALLQKDLQTIFAIEGKLTIEGKQPPRAVFVAWRARATCASQVHYMASSCVDCASFAYFGSMRGAALASALIAGEEKEANGSRRVARTRTRTRTRTPPPLCHWQCCARTKSEDEDGESLAPHDKQLSRAH